MLLSPRALLTLSIVGVLAAGCRRKHVPVTSAVELTYPDCGRGPLPAGDVLASGHLRAGPTSLEPDVVERFEVRQRDCLYTFTTRQEWRLNLDDVEVVYDNELRPLRAWKRMTLPGSPRADGNADIRRYELRTAEVVLTKRTPDGARTHEIIRGGRPSVVLGPGRGNLTMWIRRANLAVGAKVRELALDIREPIETLRSVTLRRDPDLFQPALGRTVRVYTVYGRESVFTDENNVVIGDLAGLRPASLVTTPAPPAMPMFGTPDPVRTP